MYIFSDANHVHSYTPPPKRALENWIFKNIVADSMHEVFKSPKWETKLAAATFLAQTLLKTGAE